MQYPPPEPGSHQIGQNAQQIYLHFCRLAFFLMLHLSRCPHAVALFLLFYPLTMLSSPDLSVCGFFRPCQRRFLPLPGAFLFSSSMSPFQVRHGHFVITITIQDRRRCFFFVRLVSATSNVAIVFSQEPDLCGTMAQAEWEKSSAVSGLVFNP